MEYFKKMLQNYDQFDIEPHISYSKGALEQLSMEEPILVIWTKEYQGINITSYTEYAEYIKNVKDRCDKYNLNEEAHLPEVIKVITDSYTTSEIMDILMSHVGRERLELLSKLNYNKKLHSRK